MQPNKTFSLKKEFLKKRTLFSFGLSLNLIYLFFSNVTLEELIQHAKTANPFFLLLAFVLHYASHLFRGIRWKTMLRPIGFSGSSLDLTKITFLLQSVDCVLPAKLGDVYGAHLMKINFSLPRSFAFGSIFFWRLLDLVFVAVLVSVTAFLLFGNAIPSELLMGIKIVLPGFVVLLVFLAIFSRYHTWFSSLFCSEKIHTFLSSFRDGLQFRWSTLPSLLLSTIIIWGLEVARFYFVCRAMAVELSIVQAIFITLAAMLFTAVPFTPAGLGAVELGMMKLLEFIGMTSSAAYPLIIWDRIISHWSQVLLGVVFVIFSKPINVKIWHTEEDQLPENSLAHSS